MKRKTRGTLRAVLGFSPLVLLMIAIVFLMVESASHDEAEHVRELTEQMK
jgi:hypothetical protein